MRKVMARVAATTAILAAAMLLASPASAQQRGSEFLPGVLLTGLGGAFTAIGTAVLVVGSVAICTPEGPCNGSDPDVQLGGGIAMAVGGAAMAVGIPLIVLGWSVDENGATLHAAPHALTLSF